MTVTREVTQKDQRGLEGGEGLAIAVFFCHHFCSALMDIKFKCEVGNNCYIRKDRLILSLQ